MSFEIHVDEATRIAFMTIRGPAKLPELVAAVAALAPGGKYLSNRRLWDLRQMTVPIAPEELELLGRAALTRDSAKLSRVAIVVKQDLAFRLSKLFEIYRGSPEVSVQAFKNSEDAISWLTDVD